MLRKGVYPYEYIDNWENFNDSSLPEKEDFYSHLNIEDTSFFGFANSLLKWTKIFFLEKKYSEWVFFIFYIFRAWAGKWPRKPFDPLLMF